MRASLPLLLLLLHAASTAFASAVTITTATTTVTNKSAADANPLDVYILIDKSLSISHYDSSCIAKTGKACWNLMIDFVEDLTSALALATNGIGADGLRVGLTWFSCLDNVPVTKQFVSPASGDKDVLAAAFAKLQSIKPAGGTCPSEGLKGIYDDIAATAEMTRPKAVLLMTDGLIEDSDQKKALQQGTNIRNLGAMFFTLSVGSGNLNKADKAKQSTQLTSLSGGEADRMFAADNAQSLEKVVTIISALTFNSFQASFAPAVLQPEFCFSPQAQIVLNGPSVDHIDFGVDLFLRCSFGYGAAGNADDLETTATRTNGVLACAVPEAAFPLSVLSSAAPPASVVRTLQVSLVLAASNGERRALKFSKKLSLVLAKQCFNPVLVQDCGSGSAGLQQSVSFALSHANTKASEVSCRFTMAKQSVFPLTPTQFVTAEGLVQATTTKGDDGKYMCEVSTAAAAGGLVSAVDVYFGATSQISGFPLASSSLDSTCQTASLRFDGNGCYGSNLVFHFDGLASTTASSSSSLACYFRASEALLSTSSDGNKGYEKLTLTADGECLLPVRLQRTEGVLAVASTQDGLIQLQIDYSGAPPDFANSNECVRLLAVLGAGGCQHFAATQQDDIKLQFASPSSLEGFVCDFASAGTSPVVAIVGTLYWTCKYLAPAVTVRKDAWVVSTVAGIAVPESEVCASFYMGGSGGMNLCWGDKAAQVTVQGESLNGAVGLQCTIHFQSKQYTSSLVLHTDTMGTCALPVVFGSVGQGEMRVTLARASGATLASHVFPHVELAACTEVTLLTATSACSQVQINSTLVAKAVEFGLTDLACVFGNFAGTQTVTAKLSTSTAQCALPMSASSTVQVTGKRGQSGTLVLLLDKLPLDVSKCSLRLSSPVASGSNNGGGGGAVHQPKAVCYGSKASITIEYDTVAGVNYYCQFTDAAKTLIKATVVGGALACSFPYYGPSTASVSVTLSPGQHPAFDLTALFALDTTGGDGACASAAAVRPQCDGEFKREIMLSGSVFTELTQAGKLGDVLCQYTTTSTGTVATTPVSINDSNGLTTCSTPSSHSTGFTLNIVLQQHQQQLQELVVFTLPQQVPACVTASPTTARPTTRRPTTVDEAPSHEPTLSPSTRSPSSQPTTPPPTTAHEDGDDYGGVDVVFTDAPSTTAAPTRTTTATPTKTNDVDLLPVGNGTQNSNSGSGEHGSDDVGGAVAAVIIILLALLLCFCCTRRWRRGAQQRGRLRAGEMVIAESDLEKQNAANITTPTKKKPSLHANLARFKLKQSPAVTNVMPATLQPVRMNIFASEDHNDDGNTRNGGDDDDMVAPQDDILETIDVDPKPFELGQFLKESLLPASLLQRLDNVNNNNQLANVEQPSLEEAMTEVSLIGPDLVRVVVHHNNHREGLGLSLGRTAGGVLLVDTFLRNGRQTAGPLESCGAVWAGDALIEVNDINVQGWSLKECATVIRKQRALKHMTEITFVFKTRNRNMLLGYGAYQVTVPRGLVDLGLVFERNDRLVVVHKNKLAPLRNIVTLGSRLTAVDGVPVGTLQELRQRTSLDGYFNVPTVRLRFESPTNPIALKAARVGDSFREGRTGGIKSAVAATPDMTTSTATTAYVL